jgi:hypothetical protein
LGFDRAVSGIVLGKEMSLFRSEYQSDLSIDECAYRLSDEYVRQNEGRGIRYQVGDRSSWFIFPKGVIKGEHKLVCSDLSIFSFVFFVFLSTEEGKTRVSCRYNPLRPGSWGYLFALFPFSFAGACLSGLIGAFLSPADAESAMGLAGLMFAPASLTFLICGVKRGNANMLMDEHIKKRLEARPLR